MTARGQRSLTARSVARVVALLRTVSCGSAHCRGTLCQRVCRVVASPTMHATLRDLAHEVSLSAEIPLRALDHYATRNDYTNDQRYHLGPDGRSPLC